MTEDQDSARASAHAVEGLSAEMKSTGALGRIALCALAQSSPKLRDVIEASIDAEVLDLRVAGTPADMTAATALLKVRASLGSRVPLTADGETLERVLIAAARHV